jgi:pyruvate/2-oxoglutarate dehydrogenase complex dihydrolipoamide dehydrogenase (E3) component
MSSKRDLVIIGGGAGGLVVASVAAQLGLDVVLINREEAMGGDCLHHGCVPSKALIKSAKVAHAMSVADRWGLAPASSPVDMTAINRAVARAVETIQIHDSRERFEALGCEVVTGEAEFSAAMQVSVSGQRFDARRIVIATGSSAFIPPIKGLDQVRYLTNEDMFSLPSLPESLLILGGGAIGVEMAQAWSRLGTRVTVVELAPRLIARMDTDSSRALYDVLTREGVSVYLNSEVDEVTEITQDDKSLKQLRLKDGSVLTGDELLVAIGRRACVDKLGLATAGVDFDSRGIKVNHRMQTTNNKIYACGDVTGIMPLTHVAELQAGIIIANIVFKLPKKISYDVIPSVIYTQPEVAQVGLTVEQCERLRHGEVHQFDLSRLDRAITENETAGVAKILTDRGRVVGAHIVSPHAGELIHEMALAVQEKMKVERIASLVHAYPSYAQLNKRLAGQYFNSRLFSPMTKRIVAFLKRFTW